MTFLVGFVFSVIIILIALYLNKSIDKRFSHLKATRSGRILLIILKGIVWLIMSIIWFIGAIIYAFADQRKKGR